MRKFLLCFALLVPPVPGAVIFDGVFANPDWTATDVSWAGSSGGSYGANQSATGGNPNEYRADTHSMTSNNVTYTSISIFNRFNPQALVLSTALASLSYQWDVRLDNGSTLSVAFRPALEQNGVVYHTVGAAQGATSSAWSPNSTSNLTAASFCRATPGFFSGNDTFDCSQNPDFSAGAANIWVGYVIGNSFAGAIGSTGSYASGIDNFQVTSDGGTLTPEPAGFVLTATGIALCGVGLRRRART